TQGAPPQGQPAAPAPPLPPFLTPEQMMDAEGERFNIEEAMRAIQRELETLKRDVTHEKKQTTEQENKNVAQSVENMVARGIRRSSIAAGELTDIRASASDRRKFLEDTL